MPRTKISEFSSTPASNTDIDSINIAENCPPSGINDAIRELMAQLKDWQSGTSNDPYVVGSSGSLTLNQGTANGVAYLNGSKVVTSGSALTFDGSGKFALGNVAHTSFIPTTVLTLGNSGENAEIRMGQADTKALISKWVYNATVGSAYGALETYGQTNYIQFGASDFRWQVASSEQMRLTSTGLGIGTSSPVSKLTVLGAGTINAPETTTTGGSIQTASYGITTRTGNLELGATDSLAANIGGSLTFSARYSGTNATWVTGKVGAYRDTATSGVASSYLAFATTTGAGDLTERMRLDSSGNLGLGVTPSAWFSVYKPMQLGSYGAAIAGQTNAQSLSLWNNAYPNASNVDTYTTTNAANKFRMDGGAFQFFTAASGTAGNAITFRQAMTLDSSGNLLVGTTSFGSTAVGFGINGDTSSSSRGACISIINSSVNGNTTYEAYSLSASAYRFYVGMGGTVYATSTTITAISDQRLKENIRDLDEGLATVMALKPRKFDWKSGKGADIKNARGFIAQEFETVLPDMIETWRDPAPEGEEPYKAINANLIPTLVKAIQELKMEFDAYKATHP